jgi:hypothetical protein
MILGGSKPGDVLVFKGMIPDATRFTANGVNLTLTLNGQVVQHVNLKPGNFTVTAPITASADFTKVEINFDDAEFYGSRGGKRDLRPLSAYIRELALESAANLSAFNTYEARKADGFAFDGIDTDGWGALTASFRTPVFAEAKTLVLEVEMPGWAPLASNDLTIQIDGKNAETVRLPKQTVQTLRVALPAGGAHDIKLFAAQLFDIPNGDARKRSYLLKAIRFE